MDDIHFRTDEIQWQALNPFPEHKTDRWRHKRLLDGQQGNCREWIFGLAELCAGQALPMHVHRNEMFLHILGGQAAVELGARSVEVGPSSGVYFPAGKPHRLTSLGPQTLRYLYTYVVPDAPPAIDWGPADPQVAAEIVIENKLAARWAVHEDFEPWQFWEPSKGDRLRYRILFDREHGHASQGITIYTVGPHTHYTRHFHGDAEIYYIISGSGIMSVGDTRYEIGSGSALYLGPNVIHGIDNPHDEPLVTYVVFGMQTMTGWTPVEPVYTEVRTGK